MEISKNNAIFKEIKEIKRKNNSNKMVVEGLDIVEECIKENVEIQSVFYSDENLSAEAQLLLEKCKKKAKNSYKISLKSFESIREKENSVPIILIVLFKELTLNEIDTTKHKLILVNDGIELPGNLGTIYRSAYAAGVDLIINVDCITNIYKEKFLFSSRGTVFKIPTINTTYEKAQKALLDLNYDILLCEPENGTSYKNYQYKDKSAIVVGRERFGINSKWFNEKHEKIFIPMKEDINSINVGVAASIIMFDAGIKKGKI